MECQCNSTAAHVPVSVSVFGGVGVWECDVHSFNSIAGERWGAGVETQKNVLGEIGGWGRVPFNETYAPSLSTIYEGA